MADGASAAVAAGQRPRGRVAVAAAGVDAVAAVAVVAAAVAGVDVVDRQPGGEHTMNARLAKRMSRTGLWTLSLVAVCMLAAPVLGQGPAPTPAPAPKAGQTTFASPEEAVAALRTAVTAGDKTAFPKLFGPASEQLSSGDDVADKTAYALFAKRLGKLTNLVKRNDSTVILYLGAENWPFQFPIAKAGDRWFFDGDAGLEEIFNRRIGANELHTIKVCREYVRAQREYAEVDRDGDEVLEYAQHFNSSPGMKNGLYWEASEGEDESPLGPLVAYASAGSYNLQQEGPQPFHGYYFRILTRQGAKAPGGAYGYVINTNMIGGFALVAYPATWGSSGLTTFIVNQQGKVYQKDLGPQTAALATGMRAYNPDATWTLVDED